ncbi:hypothetical protein PGQ11_002870 [Apiospora arundinis]|uniref:Uncharacterized protein n=1 Tax=Apiospora arundinis TaxID=335852 RepID=A0ABR2J3F1_9PEZI
MAKTNLAWDDVLVGGITAEEIAKSRVNARESSIRRPGRTIKVMSEEEWQRRCAAAAEKRKEWYAKQAAEQAARTQSDNEKLRPLADRYAAEVNRQRQYPKLMAKKLRNYHVKPEGTAIPDGEWKASHQDIGKFLAAVLLAYHYGVDIKNGSAMGPPVYMYRSHTLQLDVPPDRGLKCYIEHRGLAASDDELRYFDGCIAKKVDFPVFLVAAVEDNLKRLSKSKDSSLDADKQILAFILEDDLLIEEITEVILESMEK